MTQIVTVSAVTAAYATEPLKASARVSGAALTAEATQSTALEARKADTQQHLTRGTVIVSAALTQFFLKASQQQGRFQQVTLREAEEAYFSDIEPAEDEAEWAKTDPDAAGQDGADEQPDQEDAAAAEDAAFEPDQPAILALPAPDMPR